MTNEPVVKYIVVDEYKPLYALAKAFGPQRGPIRKPISVKTGIIKELLKQHNGPKIFEVIPVGKEPNGDTIFSNRVELTLENYNISWYEIQGLEIPVINGASVSNTDTTANSIPADKPVDDLNVNSNDGADKVPGEQIPPVDSIGGEEMNDHIPDNEKENFDVLSGTSVSDETVDEPTVPSGIEDVKVAPVAETPKESTKRSERKSNKPDAK